METSQRILTAARAAFERGGLDGLSLRAIADEVGITPMAVYRHYANKEALVDALVMDALADWSARVAAIRCRQPRRWLRAVGDAYLEFALREPRRYEAAFLLRSAKARRFPDDFEAGQSPAGALQLAMLERLQASGELRAVQPIEALIAYAAMAQGLVTLHRAGRIAGDDAAFRSLFRRTLDRCLASLLVEKRR